MFGRTVLVQRREQAEAAAEKESEGSQGKKAVKSVKGAEKTSTTVTSAKKKAVLNTGTATSAENSKKKQDSTQKDDGDVNAGDID